MLDTLNINGTKYTPEQFAITVGFGLSYVEMVDWIRFHYQCNTFGEKRVCKWIEDFFTEINYHKEANLLKELN